MTTLTEVVRHPIVRERFSHPARRPPKRRPRRRSATRARIGGNVTPGHALLVLPRRAGRAIAPAATSATRTRREALNREHAIFDADRCVAVNPSDTAPGAHCARCPDGDPPLERRARRRGRGLLHRPRHRHHAHDRAAPGRAADGHPDPGHVRGRALSTSRRSPTATCGTSRSSTSRRRWSSTAGTIQRIRIAANGVAARPRRLVAVENVVRGRAPDEETADGRWRRRH